jgi:tRNA(fMet)-specific endonuclease VapC
MIAFDTDVLTEILLGSAAFVTRAFAIPVSQQALPIIVIEEIMRGRLNVIRQAEARKSRGSIDRAYKLFQETFCDFRRVQILSYTSQAESLYQQWRKQHIRISTHDLRIAAICVAHDAILVSRNRRDFERVPGLKVKFWE